MLILLQIKNALVKVRFLLAYAQFMLDIIIYFMLLGRYIKTFLEGDCKRGWYPEGYSLPHVPENMELYFYFILQLFI